MQFRTELHLKSNSFSIQYTDKLLLLGSCFSESIARALELSNFQVISNPLGVLFHPIALQQSINDYVTLKKYTSNEIFEHQSLYRTWHYGIKMTAENGYSLLQKLNESIENTHYYLKEAQYLFITLGTAWIYELITENKVVANCHKMPQNLFQKRLLRFEEIYHSLQNSLEQIQSFNPQLHLIFTLSPVRHTKYGLIENNQSKALLLTAVHQLIMTHKNTSYFPSYELMYDDLRDYRFYEADMIHPNAQAIQYIWEKFKTFYFDEKTLQKVQRINQLKKILAHCPISSNETYRKQIQQYKIELKNLMNME